MPVNGKKILTLDDAADSLLQTKAPIKKVVTLDDAATDLLKKKVSLDDGVARLGNLVKTSSTLSVGSDLSKEGGGDEGFSGVSSLLPDELNGQRGVSLIVSKIAPKISPNIHKPEKVEDFIARFEDETGRKTFDLSAPQEASNILETGRAEKKKKEHEEKKFLTYSEDKKKIDESLNNINSLNGSFNDFFELKKKAPKIFEAVKSSYGIDVPLDEIEDTPNKEDKYVSRIANAYKSAAAEQKLEFFRQRRSEIGTEIESTLPSASEFTGQPYSAPQSIEDAKKIIADINDKKAAIVFALSNKDLSISEFALQLEKANGEIEKGERVLPSLRKVISGFVFDEESKNNPNVSPFEVGKKIYSIIDPQGYDLYVQAGGDKMYRAGGGFGQGYSDTPKKADAINRRITEYGIDAFQTFGNKAAIEKAGDENNFLKWKFTKPIEEETKHMIAAQLFAQGIKPNKATDEMKDAIAETLPQTNKDVWFNSNKPGNNTALPSSGFGYSAKESYNQTVEDASKTLLGWMMPGRGRERALDILEQQGTSNIVGENPESKARLYALKQKEKQGALTADEIKEKEALSQFTDVRTNWQKFKDLAGSGVGQFTGFGTISAFTGGLGNAKNAATAVKALVSPMADREGMLIGGYLMSREGNARDVVAMFPGENDGVKRFVAGEVFSFIDTYIERLFPEEKFLSISVKKDIAKLLPKLTADNIRKELNVSLAEKVAKTFVKKLAAQQGTPLQEATEEMVAAKIKDVFHGILDPDREAITFDEILNIGTQSYLSTQVIGVPKGLMATRNKTVPINAIWDAASTKGGYGDVMHTILEMQQKGDLTMDQANERISLLKTARKHWDDSPVLSGNLGNLSVPKKQNYLARLMNESVLQEKVKVEEKKTVPDKNIIKKYKDEISESEKIRAKIFNGELDVTERNNEKPVAAEIKKEDDKWKKNIVAIEERTDISDIEKERLKQMEDDRHAGEVSTITKNLNNNKQAAPIFTDFDDTVFKDGKLTDIGLSLKEKAANGEDVVVLTARDPTPENIKFIAEQLGIPEMSVKAGLTPDGKAAQLVPGSTYYNENDIELAEGSKVKGVNVVDVKTFKPSLTIEEVEDNLATSLPEYKTKDAIGFVNEMVDGEVIPGAYAKDAKASPIAFLQGVADQALGFTRDSKGNRIKADGKIPDVNSQYTETVVEYAKSLFPEVAISNETKDWGSLSLEEKRKLATENLPEVTDDNTEQEIIDLANNNAKFLLAKMRGEDISRPIELNPKLPGDKEAAAPISETASPELKVEAGSVGVGGDVGVLKDENGNVMGKGESKIIEVSPDGKQVKVDNVDGWHPIELFEVDRVKSTSNKLENLSEKDFDKLTPSQKVALYKEHGITKEDGSPITEKDIENSPLQYSYDFMASSDSGKWNSANNELQSLVQNNRKAFAIYKFLIGDMQTFKEIVDFLNERGIEIPYTDRMKRADETMTVEERQSAIDSYNNSVSEKTDNKNQVEKDVLSENNLQDETEYTPQELIEKYPLTGVQKVIWNLIKDIVNKLGIKVKFSSSRITEGFDGSNNPQNGEILIRPSTLKNGRFGEVLVHEVVHSLTTKIISRVNSGVETGLTSKQVAAVKGLGKLYKSIEADNNLQNKYPVKDIFEFIAHLTNDSFVKELESKDRNFIQKVVDFISDILGLNNANELAKKYLKDIIHDGTFLEKEGVTVVSSDYAANVKGAEGLTPKQRLLEAIKNNSKTTAEKYHDLKSKGIKNDFTKAVEQSLKETPTSKGNTSNVVVGSVGVGGDVISGDKVWDIAVKGGSETGDFSDMEGVIKNKNYIKTKVPINKLIENDEQLREFLETEPPKEKGRDITQPIIVTDIPIGDEMQKDGVADGFNRIAQAIANGDKEIDAYVNSESNLVKPKAVEQSLKETTTQEGNAEKVAKLEAARDMAILREKADIGELEFIAEESLPKEEVDVMRKGEVIGTKKVPNEKLRLQQKEISDKFDKLKDLLGCLTGKKGK